MREPAVRDIDKEEILKKCFNYLSEHGLDKVSMRNLCEQTGIGMGSIYYWFENKEEIIFDATEFGLELITDGLFEHISKDCNDISKLINELPERVMQYKLQLRFVYQVVTSPQYGERTRSIADGLESKYDKCTKVLAEQIGIEYEKLRPIVSIITSAILDYVVWGEKEKIDSELQMIVQFIELIKTV